MIRKLTAFRYILKDLSGLNRSSLTPKPKNTAMGNMLVGRSNFSLTTSGSGGDNDDSDKPGSSVPPEGSSNSDMEAAINNLPNFWNDKEVDEYLERLQIDGFKRKRVGFHLMMMGRDPKKSPYMIPLVKKIV